MDAHSHLEQRHFLLQEGCPVNGAGGEVRSAYCGSPEATQHSGPFRLSAFLGHL